MRLSPKISVVMPSLNQGRYIGDAIRSVIQQEYPHTELIVIDGGSKDNTLEVIREYASSITYWRSEPDHGQAEAINKGLRIATGDLVTWLNSDDQYEPGTFEKVASEFLQQPGISLLHGRALVFGEGLRPKIAGPSQVLQPNQYLSFMRFPQPSSFISRTALNKIGLLDESLHFAMDYELAARMVINGGTTAAVPDVLSRYRLHETSKSNEDLRFAGEWKTVLLNILDSQSSGQKAAHMIVTATGDNRTGKKIYPHTIEFSEKELMETAAEHLNLQFHTYYRHYEVRKCETIAKVLEANAPGYAGEQNYHRYLRRLRLFPRSLFNLYRRFTR